MPSSSCRSLYLCTCWEELETKIDVNLDNRTPKIVKQYLPTLYEDANKCMRDGDQEKAYILYMRWLHCLTWLQKKMPSTERNSLKDTVTKTQVQDVLKAAEQVADTLRKRYAERKARLTDDNIANSIEKMEIDPESIDTSVMPKLVEDQALQLPETPTDDPVNGEPNNWISCMNLYHEMKRLKDRILIIDMRPPKDFANSSIKSSRCINLPAELVKPGNLAYYFVTMVGPDKKARQLYKMRGSTYNDLLVLLDWNTTQVTFDKSSGLSIFMQILLEWDHGVRHNKIVLLNGGYSEWLNCYPTITTNPAVTTPGTGERDINEILNDVEYPEFFQSNNDDISSRPKANPVPARSLKPVKTKNDSSAIDASTRTQIHPIDSSISEQSDLYKPSLNSVKPKTANTALAGISKDNLPTENVSDFNAIEKRSEYTIEKIIKPTEIDVVKPTFDRRVKPNVNPNVLKTSDVDSKKIIDLLEQKLDVLRDLLKMVDQLSMRERHNSHPGLDYHACALEIIRQLESSMSEKREELKDIKASLLKFEADNITVKPAYQEKKDQLDLNIAHAEHDLRHAEKSRQKMLEDLENIRMTSIEKNLATPPRNEDSNVYNEPLKPDGPSMNTSLKRSYSSPNLAQMEHKESVSQRFDNAMPQVDRTSKPSHQEYKNLTDKKYANKQPVRRDREQRMNPVFGNMHPGITGLKNLGNSCYMNSIIQCLSNTTSLARYFSTGQYMDDLNANNKKMQGHVVEEVAQVIKALRCGHYRSISPRDLKIAIGQYKLQFENYDQQDSHEFLTFLLDWMHNDLKTKSKLESVEPSSSAEKEWHKAMGGQTSIISQLFFGQLRSKVSCTFCKNSSMTYESFNSLTLSMPDALRCNLDDCIQKYVSEQRVSDWRCPKCKTARDGTKKFDFIKLAPIIIIHLNRFGDTGGWLEKKNTAVEFPLTSLDLRRYVAYESGSTNAITDSYNLYAVSNHYGTMDGGHYTAYCKSGLQNKWYKYDDQTVTEVSTSEVKSQTASAYLLFYTSMGNSPYMSF